MGYSAGWPVATGIAALMGLLAMAGVLAARQVGRGGRLWVRRSLGFASGFMFAFAVVEILPEALEMTGAAAIAAVGGFSVFYVIERLFDIHLCPAGADECSVSGRHDHDHAPIGMFALVGLGAHSIIDGLAIGVALTVSPALAAMASLAVALHKLPDGFCMGSLLVEENPEAAARPMPWGLAFTFAATTPLGVVAAYAGLLGASGVAVGAMMGFAAGTFLYVAAADLLPEAHLELKTRSDRIAVMTAVVGGVALAAVLSLASRA